MIGKLTVSLLKSRMCRGDQQCKNRTFLCPQWWTTLSPQAESLSSRQRIGPKRRTTYLAFIDQFGKHSYTRCSTTNHAQVACLKFFMKYSCLQNDQNFCYFMKNFSCLPQKLTCGLKLFIAQSSKDFDRNSFWIFNVFGKIIYTPWTLCGHWGCDRIWIHGSLA